MKNTTKIKNGIENDSMEKRGGIIAILCFLGIPLYGVGIITSEYLFGKFFPEWVGLLIIPSLFVFLSILSLFYIMDLPTRLFLKLSMYAKNIEKIYIKELENIGTIDQILITTKKIYNRINAILLYSRILTLVTLEKNRVGFKKYIGGLSLMTLTTLINLRSDLSIRLTEQQQSLESAKSKVEKHIQGTTELEQVSELQKMRLDKQIEQFEELQRVLIKV